MIRKCCVIWAEVSWIRQYRTCSPLQTHTWPLCLFWTECNGHLQSIQLLLIYVYIDVYIHIYIIIIINYIYINIFILESHARESTSIPKARLCQQQCFRQPWIWKCHLHGQSLSLSLYLPLSPSSPLYSDTVYIQKKTTHLTPASFRFDVLILCKVKHRSSLLLTGIAWCVPMGTLHWTVLKGTAMYNVQSRSVFCVLMVWNLGDLIRNLYRI